MSQLTEQPAEKPTGKKKELSNEVRTVIAFILMGLILLATPYVYRMLGIAPPPPADAKKTQAAAKDPARTSDKPAGPQSAASVTASGTPMTPSAKDTGAAPVPNAVSASSEQEQIIDTAVYRVVFSNRGAVVKSWTLKNYKDSVNKPLEIVNQTGANKTGYPFSVTFRGKQPDTDLNKALWVAHPEGLTIRYEFSDGSTAASKTFAFQRDGSIVQYSDEVSLNGSGLSHLVQWRGGFGDMAVQNASGQQATIRYDIEKQKLVRDAAKSAKNGPVTSDGTFSFAGIDDQYFAAAFLPPPNTPLQTTTFDDLVASKFNAAEDAYPGVAVGGASRNQFGIYIGPKEINALHSVNPKLDGIVDWGFFGIIAKPLFLVLHWLNDQFLHNYGWSIIVLTIFINIALFPLRLTNLKSMRKMQVLQPEMTAINNKYKGISMKDPKAANKQQEMMDLYKKHGVNPMGGCLPLLIQMPFLWAFYKVLSVTIEMRHADFLWLTDLSQPEQFAIRVLPLVMVVTSFALQKMTPVAAGADPSQQKMMQFMPLMYLFFFWNASSGLVLYWLTGNIVGIAQQWFFNKTAVPIKTPALQAAQKQISKDGRKRT
jgi:YidC/Oxa1 family membrane protein insertase